MTAFADIVLLSFNATTAIVFQVILSIIFLKEKLILKYDLPALILIIAGSACIILTANFSDLSVSVATLKDYLTSGKSIAFFAVTLSLLNLTFFVQKRMLLCLAVFERDTEKYLKADQIAADDRENYSPQFSVQTESKSDGDNNNDDYDEDNFKRAHLTTIESQSVLVEVSIETVMKEPRRAARVLLPLLGNLPKELIADISPEAGMKLRNNIKVPIILLTLCSSLCGGSSLVMMKSFNEIVNGTELSEHKLFAFSLLIMALSAAGMQTYMLNLSMKYFNNIDVMPIYQSFVLINWMVSGLILLNESSLYSWSELVMLGASCLLVILGIFVLTLKQS